MDNFKLPQEWKDWKSQMRILANAHSSLTIEPTDDNSNENGKENLDVSTTLTRNIQSELNESRNFEERLLAAMESSDEKEEMNNSSVYPVPAVAYVSPSMAKLVSKSSPNVRLQKKRKVFESQTLGSPKRKPNPMKSDDPNEMMEDLQDRIEDDLNASYNFEKRLQEALNNS